MSERCLIILPGGYPPGDAKALRMSLLAAGLAASGVETRILALGGNNSMPMFRADDYGTLYAEIPITQNHQGAGFAAVAQAVFVDWDFQSMIVYGPFWSILDDVCGWALRVGIKVYADCTEWYVWRPWRLLNPAFRDHLRFRANLVKLSGAIAISDFWVDYLNRKRVPCVKIPAPVDPRAYEMAPSCCQSSSKSGQQLTLSYFGALSTRNLALTLLESVHLASNRGLTCTLHCYGHQPLDPDSHFMKRMRALRLEGHVVLHGRLRSRYDVLGAMQAASVSLLLRGNDSASQGSFATRIPELLLSGRPLITSSTRDIRTVLVDRQDAYLIPPGKQPEAVVKALTEISRSPHEAEKIGRAGQQTAVKVFDYVSLGARLAEFIHDARHQGAVAC